MPNDLRSDVLQAVARDDRATATSVAHFLDTTTHRSFETLFSLANEGLLRRHGSTYSLTPKGLVAARESLVASIAELAPEEHRAAMANLDEDERLRRKEQLSIEFDPEATKQKIIDDFESAAIVAGFLDDPNEYELTLSEELLVWCAENEDSLIAASALLASTTTSPAGSSLRLDTVKRVGKQALRYGPGSYIVSPNRDALRRALLNRPQGDD